MERTINPQVLTPFERLFEGIFYTQNRKDPTMSDKFHDATQPLEKVKTQDKRDMPDTSAPVEVEYSDHS